MICDIRDIIYITFIRCDFKLGPLESLDYSCRTLFLFSLSLPFGLSMPTHVKTHSLFLPVDKLFYLLIELASLNSVVDRLVHACWNRLLMA